jgi:hypothetical protein
MTIRRAVVFVLVLFAASRADAQFSTSDPAPGEQFHVELSALFWSPTPELSLNTGGLTDLGIGEVDFVQEFGIEKQRFTEYRVTLKPARHHKLRYSSVPIEYTPSATLTRTVQFGGLTIPVSAPATADIKWTLHRYGYEWDFVAKDRGYLGVIAELKDNNVAATVTAEGYGTEAAQKRAPIPTIGIGARGYPHKLFSITGELTGFKVPDRFKDQLSGKFIDFDIYGTLSFGRNAAVQGGYRSVLVDYIVDDDTGHLRMKGLYWGGLVRF